MSAVTCIIYRKFIPIYIYISRIWDRRFCIETHKPTDLDFVFSFHVSERMCQCRYWRVCWHFNVFAERSKSIEIKWNEWQPTVKEMTLLNILIFSIAPYPYSMCYFLFSNIFFYSQPNFNHHFPLQCSV